MRARIRQAFQKALEDYSAKKDRGIEFGWFSGRRHSYAKTPRIESLEKALTDSSSDLGALIATLEFLLSKDTSNNNHSFSQYLIGHLNVFVGEHPWSNREELEKLLVEKSHELNNQPQVKVTPHFSDILKKDLDTSKPPETAPPSSRLGRQSK